MPNTYQESELQAYVERHFAADLNTWLGGWPQYRARVLGAQVPCANGIIDVLGLMNFFPVVVELKAETATEKVAGQIARYHAAVEEMFSTRCINMLFDMNLQWDVRTPERFTTSIVIAPDYTKSAADALSGTASWLLQATPNDAGSFDIRPFDSGKHLSRSKQPHLERLLENAAREYVGWRLGATMSEKHRELQGRTSVEEA